MDTSLLQAGIFRNPRPKKSVLPPPSKKRKVVHAIEEIAFDDDRREDYLTGFHKRKVQRIKRAQEESEKKAKEERRELRKQLREERKEELQQHVKAINRALKDTERPTADSSDQDDSWDGIHDLEGDFALAPLDQQEEYVDEDKYTTVTVEEVDISKHGLHKLSEERKDPKGAEKGLNEVVNDIPSKKKNWPRKDKTKKFRYESKAERRITRGKQKIGNKARADARRAQ